MRSRGWLGVYLDAGVTERELEGLLIEAHRNAGRARPPADRAEHLNDEQRARAR